MPKLKLVTFGCQANELDSERIAGLLGVHGYHICESLEEADLIILNTCSIREKAEQKVYSQLGRLQALKRRKPEVSIGICGCLAQQEGERLKRRFPSLDLIAGPQDLYRIPSLLAQARSESALPILEEEWPDIEPRRESSIKAWVGIMEGCDNFCSYCVVPHTRGRERSRPMEEILREIEGLQIKGYKEITLLGQNVNSYGKGLEPRRTFPELLHRIDSLAEGRLWVRFATSHPRDLNENLAEALTLPSICEHLHLPVQSGSTRTLERMNRGYTREEYLARVSLVRERVPEIALTTDIIVGFPGETEKDFQDTMALLEEVRFDNIFSFKFSPRPRTQAATFPDQLPEEVKAKRLEQVQGLQARVSLEKNRDILGKEVEVLVEDKEGPILTGRTRQNKVVHFNGGGFQEGDQVRVRILEAFPYHLKGEAVHIS